MGWNPKDIIGENGVVVAPEARDFGVSLHLYDPTRGDAPECGRTAHLSPDRVAELISTLETMMAVYGWEK